MFVSICKSASDPYRGFAPGPHRGISVLETPSFATPTPNTCRCYGHWNVSNRLCQQQNKSSTYRCKKERSVAFKICQNAFPGRHLPRTALRVLTTLLRSPSCLGRWGRDTPRHTPPTLLGAVGGLQSASGFRGGALTTNIILENGTCE